jgi:non-specific serine/threonine protein kinase
LLAAAQPAKGLLLTIADASWLDEASVQVVQRLLRLPEGFEHVGLVYAAIGNAQTRFRAFMYANITLPPLDLHEVRAWIRHALRWEPPEAMARWVWEQTEGLPEKVHQTLTALVHRGGLQPLPEGWRWQTPTDWEPPASVAAAPAQIGVPTDLPLLFGRNRDLWVLQEAVKKFPLVTVRGAGGVGKSRLLQQLALESHEHFPDGVRYIALEGVSGNRLATALARGLRIPLQMRSEVFPQIAQHLQNYRMLLVLDGVAAAPEATTLLSRLASAAPQNRWVVGALWQLHLPTEHVIRLGGLETREEEGASPAAHLFFYIARRSGGGQHCSESRQREEIEAICRWAEGSPMAVRILASWCNTLTPAQILKSLSHVKTRTNPLEAALDAFWEALSPDERRRLALLALFEGAFPLAAAREVADASLFFLDALAAKTYLSRRSGGRFYLHPLLQQYARARLQAFPAEVAQAERQHAFWYLKRLPETGGAHTEADRWGFVASEDDLPDVIEAWQWALRHREAALLAEAAPWVFPSLGEQNRFTETSALVDESVASLRRWLPKERTHAYFLLRAYLEVMRAEFLYHLGDYQEALHRLQRVYRRQFPLLPPLHQAHVTAVLGRVYSAVGDYAAAVSFMEHAYQVYQQENVRPLLLSLLNAIGIAAYGQGDLTAAEHFFGKALEISREQEKPRAVAALLNNLGNITWQRGRHQQAERLLREALRLLHKEDAPSLKASVLDSVARVESAQGAYQRALNHLHEAITLSQRISAWPNALVAMSTAAYVWAEIGHPKEAADLLATITRYRELPHYDYAQVQEVMQRLPKGEPLTTTDVASLAQYVLNQNRLWGMELSHATPNASSGGSS